MKDADLIRLFKEEAADLKVDENKKEDSIRILKNAVDRKEVPKHVSWWTIAGNQVRYVDKEMLFVQTLFFCIASLFLVRMSQSKAGWAEYLAVGAVFAVILGIFAFAGIRRQYAGNFAELGEACYFNVRQMTALRILIFGTADAIFLLILTGIVSGSTGRSVLEIGVYLCVPFVVAEGCYTGLMLTEMGRRSLFPAAGMGLVMAVVFTAASLYPEIYERSAVFVWYCIFAASVFILAGEIRILFRQLEKGEILCTH